MAANVVTFVSSDLVEFEVPIEAASASVVVRDIIEDTGGASMSPIRLESIGASTLEVVVDFMQEPRTSDYWVCRLSKLPQEQLFDVVNACNFLNIEGLLDPGAETIASMIRNKSPEELRRVFDVPNDFSPEEIDRIRRDNEWIV
jgi:S-phase kinase-associated protein 1